MQDRHQLETENRELKADPEITVQIKKKKNNPQRLTYKTGY